MKNFLVSFIILMFIAQPVYSQSNNIKKIEIKNEVENITLTDSSNQSEFNFKINNFNFEATKIYTARILYTQTDDAASNSIINFIYDDSIIKALSASTAGEKEILDLEGYISEGTFTIKLYGEKIDKDLPINIEEIKLQIFYENLDITDPELVSYKFIEITPDTITIEWESNEPTKSVINYGRTSTYTDQVDSRNLLVEEIEKLSDPEYDPEIEEIKIEEYSTKHSVIITDLLPGSTYHFSIVLEDMAGNISESKDKTFITPLTDRESEVLGADSTSLSKIKSLVGNLQLDSTGYFVELSWSRDYTNIDKFIIYRKKVGSNTEELAKLDDYYSTYVDRDVEEGEFYTYTIRYLSGNSISPQSDVYDIEIIESNISSTTPSNIFDTNRIVIFLVTITFGALTLGYFIYRFVKSSSRSFQESSLGKNKMKDPEFVQTEFEKRFVD